VQGVVGSRGESTRLPNVDVFVFDSLTPALRRQRVHVFAI
jgi:hypothetical protein